MIGGWRPLWSVRIEGLNASNSGRSSRCTLKWMPGEKVLARCSTAMTLAANCADCCGNHCALISTVSRQCSSRPTDSWHACRGERSPARTVILPPMPSLLPKALRLPLLLAVLAAPVPARADVLPEPERPVDWDEHAPPMPAPPPAELVPPPADFVCEADVRAAIRENRKITIGPRTIVTPSARDLAAPNDILVVTQG